MALILTLVWAGNVPVALELGPEHLTPPRVASTTPAAIPAPELAAAALGRRPETPAIHGLLPTEGALRLATPQEREFLRGQVGRELALLDRQVTLVQARSRGVRTSALLLTLEKQARRRAVAREVADGRLFLRQGPLPDDVMVDLKGRDGEFALLDDGDLRGVVFLDPILHPGWAALRAEVRATGVKSPANAGPASLTLGPERPPRPYWTSGDTK